MYDTGIYCSFESEALAIEVQEKASKENYYTNKSFVSTHFINAINFCLDRFK